MGGKSLEQFQHIERLSRQTRHYRTHLNRISDQKLQENLGNLTNRYQQNFLRLKTDRKLEEQRQQLLNVTVKQIANERQRPLSSKPINTNPSTENSCRLFSHNCQLYPCQPIYHYRSFMNKEHDQTLRERNPSTKTPDVYSPIQELTSKIEEKKYDQTRRQFALTLRNQSHLANRHVYMTQTMARLDEQSRLLRERLVDKKQFTYIKEDQYVLKQAIKRHLEISAKFCASN